RALYAFCRITDDLVDECVGRTATDGAAALALLEDWRQRSLGAQFPSRDPVVIAWTDARMRYGIPQTYAEQLIEGVAQDLNRSRYRTFDQLSVYCYSVASTVGLMSMHIIGFVGLDAIPYAVK